MLFATASQNSLARSGKPHLGAFRGHSRLAQHGTHRPRSSVGQARAAIVGGVPITIEQAPWQVAVGSEKSLCSGAIIDPSHVLTAAHCVFDSTTGALVSADDLFVIAGSSDIYAPETERQSAGVSSVRVHPYYAYTPNSGHVNPDDVAVLTLEEPLAFGPSVGPISLVASGVYQALGTAATFTGFGVENQSTKELNGKLYSLAMSVGASEQCGGEKGEADAVLLCASSPAGSPCGGDSGSVLTTAGSSPVVLGVMNDYAVIGGKGCLPGADSSFANVASPEIQDFIDGSESPPRAPRGGGTSCSTANPVVGGLMSCQAGTWSNSPTFTYTFVDSQNGQILQAGPGSEYKFSAALTGATVYMRLQASNAGGTATSQTVPSPTIGPAPPTPEAAVTGRVSLPSSIIPIHGSVAIIKLACVGTGTCIGRLSLTSQSLVKIKGKRRLHTIAIATKSFSISHEKTGVVAVKLNSAGLGLLRGGHRRVKAQLVIAKSSPTPPQTQSRNVILARSVSHTQKHNV